MGIIKIKDLIFEYIRRDEEGNVEGITKAVDDVNLDIKQGDFVAILGHNGSGRGCWIWTGEHGCRDEGNMGESE